MFSLISSNEILTLRAKDSAEADKWVMVLSDWLLMHNINNYNIQDTRTSDLKNSIVSKVNRWTKTTIRFDIYSTPPSMKPILLLSFLHSFQF